MPQLRTTIVLLLVCAFVDPTCAEEATPAHFHHVRLNTQNPSKSLAYYQKYFGAVPIKFAGAQDALFVERSFLLFNKVQSAPQSELQSAIWHIGWGGVDIQNEYLWLKRHGAEFQTTPQPLPGIDNFYMYLKGPAGELIEINTMGHHRFAHVHFFADDVNSTCEWYARHLGLSPRRAKVPKPKGDPNTLFGIWMNFITCDNVQLIFFGKPDFETPVAWWPDPPLKEFKPTKDRPIDHLAFSYADIGPTYERMKSSGVKILSEPKIDPDFGFKSFYVQGPDRVLIEIVESEAIPDVLWKK